MTPELARVLAALPEEIDESTDRGVQQDLDLLLAGLGRKPVPVGRLTRFWLVGGLQAKIALAYLVWWLRSRYVSEDNKQRSLNEVHLRAALRMVQTMGYMRGTIMKIGQVLANYPAVFPSQFMDMLGVLHFEAPPMHYSLLREQLRRELGDEPERCFATFERQAFAAASLGQVHRATLKTGERVAVKVQYPNIARTIESDFRNFNAAVFPMRLLRDWDNLKTQWSDICEQLLVECDYRREAETLRDARRHVEGLDGVVVPRVHEEFSTRRVLTMDYLDGVHLADYLQQGPDQAERNRQGTRMFHAMTRLYYAGRMMYADPHPGNYLFMRDGRLGLLDFGCCRRFTDEEWDYISEVERATDLGFDADHAALGAALARGMEYESEADADREAMKLTRAWCRWLMAPAQVDGPFDFGDVSYIREGMEIMASVIRGGHVRNKPVNTWLGRGFVGVRCLLQQLGARVDAGRLLQIESSAA